jgi:hypothetical protein
MGTTTSNPYGANSGNDNASYNIARVTAGSGQVTTAKFREIETAVNQERIRRGAGSGPVVTARFIGFIEAADLNFLRTSVEVQGVAPNPSSYTESGNNTPLVTRFFTQAAPPYGDFFGVDRDVLIYADDVNNMINKVVNAGQVCVCNCNYCTCNCNYCTCNCDYACTCNCNYSDVRLKTDIEFVGVSNGLNTYTFKYIWDKTTTYFGIMAQELLGTKYELALNKDSNNYYIVDYSKLPIKMAKV